LLKTEQAVQYLKYVTDRHCYSLDRESVRLVENLLAHLKLLEARFEALLRLPEKAAPEKAHGLEIELQAFNQEIGAAGLRLIAQVGEAFYFPHPGT
jgi:hypothetical protein